MVEYTVRSGGTRAVILPEKGATVISLTREGTEFLYCDRENLRSPERPRCGIPFLFPIFGRLAGGTYTMDGKEYAMEIHGFGHTSPWHVAEHREDTLVLELTENECTLAQYPFRFRVQLTFRAAEGALTVHQRYENRDSRPMPYNFGFHPYFRVEELDHARVETTAGSYFDFLAGKPVPFGHGAVGVTLPQGAPETGAAFLEAVGPTRLHLPNELRRITLDHGAEFPQIVLWTQRGKPFLCVEPINGTANGLNTGIYRILNPGESREAELTIRIDNI